MSQALYLKYRPVTLDDIVGQKHIVSTLKRANESNKFSHAYLFSGNHGCGKTSTARILASMIASDNDKDRDRILHGTTMDVKELDGATNRGIDDIRDLIEGAQYSPTELKGKVYILDEMHQLSKEAVSALLKILEEPPSYLTFILCTTECRKILPTIFSRCQRFNFSKILSKDIAARLKYIAAQEKININENALLLISKMGKGSMRDAIGYLEQISVVAQGKLINEKHILQYFGVIESSGIYDIVQSVVDCNLSKLLDQINDLVMVSADLTQIMFDISEVFRNVMLIKAQNGDTKLLDLPDYELDNLRKVGDKIKLVQLSRMAKLFSYIEKKMNYNINDRWIMEATLIDCAAMLRQQK